MPKKERVRQLLVGLGTSLLLGVSVSAVKASTNIERPILLAETRNYCNANESVYVLAETQDFWVSICGGDAPYYYVGVDKFTGDSIRLSLYDYGSSGDWFEAVNGEYSYVLVRDTPRGSFLTVTEGDREILRQPILTWE